MSSSGGTVMEPMDERTPSQLREGVKAGILATIKQDAEHRGGRTARLLIAAGVLGVVGAVGVTLLVSTHPLGHHPPWHVAVFSAVWAGLLIVSLAIRLLQLRTPSLPLAHAAAVGVLGLGLAGICGAVCPDQHFLHWWSGTSIGASLLEGGGLPLSAMCFGLIVTVFFGMVAAVVLIAPSREMPIRPILPATALLVLLAPGIALQSFDTSWVVFAAWMFGTGLGACVGVAAGIRVRELLSSDPA
jgi:hypothetical protein